MVSKLNFLAMTIDQQIAISGTMQMVYNARQAAYQFMDDVPELKTTYLDLDRAYTDLCDMIGRPARPVFDKNEHIARQIAAGNRDYVETYGEKNES